jgi:hypothetical protein
MYFPKAVTFTALIVWPLAAYRLPSIQKKQQVTSVRMLRCAA